MWTPRSLLSRLTPAPLTVALVALSLPAAAGSKFDKWTGSVGQTAINGVVEVPLYTADPLKSVPMVYGKIKEEQPAVGFTLATGLDLISISSETAEKMGLEVKSANKKLINVQKWTVNKKISEEAIKAGAWKEGGAFKYVEIPSIKIGDLELKDVVAFVHPGDGLSTPFPKGNYIGLGALDQVAWSITPSDGKVRFAPAAQGATLLDKVGGTRLTYEETDSSFEKVGKGKVYVPSLTHQLPVTVGGKSVKATIASAGNGSAVVASLDFEKQATVHNGDVPIHWTTVSLGDSQLNSAWVAELQPSELSTPWLYKYSAIGSEVVSHYDIAGDPATRSLALKPTSTHNRLDPRPVTIESRIKSAEEKDKKAQEAAKDSKDGKPAKPDGAAWAAVAQAYAGAGQYAKAIEVYQGKVLAADDKDCSTWQDLGDAQQNNGQLAEAASSYSKAADLYHAWWDRPRAQREELSEQVEKAKGDGLETYVGEDGKPVYPQAGACHTADGMLAGVYIAERQFGKVEELYRKRLDLDAGLAVAWGNAAMVSGQWDKVQEPYRQALRREESWEASPRLGLALAYQQRGDWDTAADLYRTVLDLSPNDSVAGAAWLDGLRAAKGKDAAIAAAREWVKQSPTSASARYALVRELSLAGDATGLQALTTSTDAWFARKLAVDAYDLRIAAVYARYLVLTGRTDEAQKVLDKSQAADSGNAHLWVARADLLKARGDTAEALKAARKAAALNPQHPGYALMLNAPQN